MIKIHPGRYGYLFKKLISMPQYPDMYDTDMNREQEWDCILSYQIF